MLKHYFCSFLLSLLFFSSFSQKASQTEVLLLAKNFYTEAYVSAYGKDKSFENISFKHTQNNSKGEALYHLLDVENGGYIIVSAFKTTFPVLAYSFTEKFSFPISAPAVYNWMDNYEKQLTAESESPENQSVEINEAWDIYISNNFTPQKAKTVLPLLLTTWNQNKWYNEMCPDDPNGPGGKVYAGCVATSMAQHMKYFNYPLQGNGSNSYNTPYGNLSVNFSNAHYKWNEMLYSINTSNNAVAEIIYHSGVAVNMSYSANGSGANLVTAASAMKSNFRYFNGASYKYKYTHTNANWTNMMKTSFDNGIPLIYSGSPLSGAGHAWNCDGYQGSEHFHMNWGWGGSYNGYFYLNNLNVAGENLTYSQGAIFDLYPTLNYPYNCTGTKTLTALNGTFEDGSGHQNYQNNANCFWLIEPSLPVTSIKLDFYRLDTENNVDIIKVYNGATTSAPLLGTYSGTSLPPQIVATSGKMLIHFSSNTQNNASGFDASYTTTLPVYCTALTNLTASSGSFGDGSGIYTYNPNTNCRWRIMPDIGNSITLSFIDFDLNPDDVLEIYDVSTGTSMLASHTGSNIPPTQTYYTNKILVWLKANSTNPGNGFNAFYTTDIASVENYFLFNNLSIYPNPANKIVNLSFYSNYTSVFRVELFDMIGKSVLTKSFNSDIGYNAFALPIDKLSKGVYTMSIMSTTDIFKKTLIIQ